MKEIEEIIDNINKYTEHIFEGGFNEGTTLKKIAESIQKIYMEFITIIPSLNDMGMNINREIIVGQIRNITDSIKRKDTVLLFDTLRYEILDTLKFYNEIKNIMEQE
ncbi:MAG: hypothetical protein ACLRVQ_02100 [Lachnospiraceae bacterium]